MGVVKRDQKGRISEQPNTNFHSYSYNNVSVITNLPRRGLIIELKGGYKI